MIPGRIFADHQLNKVRLSCTNPLPPNSELQESKDKLQHINIVMEGFGVVEVSLSRHRRKPVFYKIKIASDKVKGYL